MHAENQSTTRVPREINMTDVEIAGAWMPCEFIRDRAGRVRFMMLADVDFEEPARSAVWHSTLAAAAAYRFEQIEPCRKMTLRVPRADRPIADCPFEQRLMRHLVARDE